MNRPKRPSAFPARRRPSGPPPAHTTPGGGPPRRRSPLDIVPQNLEPKLKVLGTVDRQVLISGAQPLEMVVIQGFTREIEDAFQRFKGRHEDFWGKHPQLIETLRKLDEVLAHVQIRKAGG